MAFRNLFIGSKAYVRSFQNRLKLENKEKVADIPFEDIGSVVLDSPQITITSSALKSIAQNNISLFVTDESHLPIGVFMSFQNHSRQAKQIKKQMAVSESFKGQIWKLIISSKIANQSKVVELTTDEERSKGLMVLSDSVKVHDSTNREAYSSNIYFGYLFGHEFTRRNSLKINSSLNYGFSIVRGVIAKNLSAYGLLPAVGVHHKNEYNNFNLADDLIESYRPIVEYFVIENFEYSTEDNDKLTKEERALLVDMLNLECKLKNKKYSLENAIEQTVKSYVSAINKNDPKLLILPTVSKFKRKYYE